MTKFKKNDSKDILEQLNDL